MVLHVEVGLGSRGARHQFAPPVTVEKPIDRTVIDLVSDSCFKGSLDQAHGSDLSALGLREERSEELLFFFQPQILTPTPSLACRLYRCDAQAVIGRDYIMHRRLGDSSMPGKFFRQAYD